MKLCNKVFYKILTYWKYFCTVRGSIYKGRCPTHSLIKAKIKPLDLNIWNFCGRCEKGFYSLPQYFPKREWKEACLYVSSISLELYFYFRRLPMKIPKCQFLNFILIQPYKDVKRRKLEIWRVVNLQLFSWATYTVQLIYL